MLALVESPLVRVRNPTKSQWAVGKGKRIRSKRRQALGLIDYKGDGHKLLWRHFTINRILIAMNTVRLLARAAVVLLLSIHALSESHSAFPVDITPGPRPQPFMAAGKMHLVYELRLTNFSASPIEVLALEVLGDTNGIPLASYRGDTLEKLLVPIGPHDNGTNVRTIAGGRSITVFLDLMLDGNHQPRAELHHRVSLSIPRKKDGTGGAIENTINAAVIALNQVTAPVLHPPLSGSGWVAFNSLGSEDHRRALVPVDGRFRIAQRYAIDWMRLGPEGRLSHGDGKSNNDFYSYGAEVLAVADGRVSDLKDGLPENVGSNDASTRNITLDNLVGNYLILDLGGDRFALYAHLQPGSLRIKLGEQVKVGQVLARLGNSGNSDAPHLHFHLMDSNSPVGAEGIPYELDTFMQLGTVDGGAEILDTGHAWQPKSGQAPVSHRHEFPVDNAVVVFPSQ